jgi:hypothetical protein
MNKLAIIATCAALCLANNGSCMGGGVNSASAAHACSVGITASMAAQDIANVFIVRGIEAGAAAKIAQAVRTFQITVETACALLPPAPPQ